MTRAHVMPAGDLTMIFELDELDDLDNGLPSNLPPDFGNLELAGEIMSVVTGHSGGEIGLVSRSRETTISVGLQGKDNHFPTIR